MDSNKTGKKFDKTIFDGLFMKNTVLASGLVVAPIVAVATTLKSAIALIIAFSLITFLTVLISSFVPRDIVYAVRIILYTVIAAMVYVPVAVFADSFMNQQFSALGIMFPLLITNSLIITRTEIHFFKLDKLRMLSEVFFYILGFDVVAIVVGVIREILATGAIGDKIIGIHFTLPFLSTTFGGFILIGILAAILKKIKLIVRSHS
ncbi:MAG: electron transport complex subunit E [Oscillospiraceae bacterium]|nr:electron transport complex subunit E [Oscillospiraceae bacterium]